MFRTLVKTEAFKVENQTFAVQYFELRTVRGAGRYIDRPCFPPTLEALALINAAAKPVGVARA